ADRLRLRVKLSAKDRPIAEDVYSISHREVARTITIPDGGIDDYRNDLLWSPSAPNLIDVQLDLIDADDRVIDSVQSYTAMRSVAAEGDRFLLNGRAIDLRLVLDQGYWPQS